ncbi:MAG: M3 family oligoendopeptidase [Cytophagales bacterium]|nr:M3 family oligoendopeptidase [Armatimonadota bacterium]
MTSLTVSTDLPPPHWDLSDLFEGPDDPRLFEMLDTVHLDSKGLAERYKGKVAALVADEPAALATAIQEYERISQAAAKPMGYINLRFAADSSPENGALLQRIREKTTGATLPLLFFDIELAQVPTEVLDRAGEASALAAYRHFLRTVSARAAYRLSEAEERVLEEQANTGRRAFIRLYEEMISNFHFSMEGWERPLTLSEVLDLQQDSDRSVRETSAEALTRGLAPHARTLTFIFNTLIQDKATDDRLRGFEYPEQARHISNELAPEIVDLVVETTVAGYPLVARYYEAKRHLLGLDKLAHYDRYAPIALKETPISFGSAQERVLSAFREFHPEYAAAAAAFFDNGWVDAATGPTKRGGAFCSYVTPDLHPYIFVNYLGKSSDVRTLAHELGHGIHSFVSRDQTLLNFHGTLPMAEVASTFAEMLVFESQQKQEKDLTQQLAATAQQIDQAIATIFRQAALYRFEQAIHAERKNGELSTARYGEIWQEKLGEMFGGSVTLEPGHALWWSYVRHFVATPFYVYAYTFGEMLAYALFTQYQAQGAATFAPNYLSLLRSGGSQSPQELVHPLGVDLADAHFWQGALAAFEAQVTRFESLAAEAAKNTGS